MGGFVLNKLSDGEQALYSEVLQSIAGMRLLPGRRLTEEALAEAFDVSRSGVRQVLTLLEADGIVSRQRNKGAYIRHLTPTEAFEVFDSRRLIELHLSEGATAKVTTSDIDALRELLAKEKHALDSENAADTTRLSGEFHMRLAAVSDHQTLLGILQPLIFSSYLVAALYQKGTLAARAHHTHTQLVKHLEAQDTPALKFQLLTHFDHVLGEMDFSENDPPSKFDKLLSE